MDIILCDHTLGKLTASVASRLIETCHLDQEGSSVTLLSVGSSGSAIVSELNKVLPEPVKKSVTTVQILVTDSGSTVTGLPDNVQGSNFVICDSIVNSGRTMEKVRSELIRRGAASARTLALVVRNGSSHIPNFYVMSISSHDRIFFGDELYPARFYRSGCIRLAQDRDSGASIDHGSPYLLKTVGEFLTAHERSDGWKTYLMENDRGAVVGLIHFQHKQSGAVFVDTLAVSRTEQRNGYGSALLSFLEDYCEFNEVTRARMYAAIDKVTVYEPFGYRKTGNSRKGTAEGDFVEMEMKYGYNV